MRISFRAFVHNSTDWNEIMLLHIALTFASTIVWLAGVTAFWLIVIVYLTYGLFVGFDLSAGDGVTKRPVADFIWLMVGLFIGPFIALYVYIRIRWKKRRNAKSQPT